MYLRLSQHDEYCSIELASIEALTGSDSPSESLGGMTGSLDLGFALLLS